MQERKHAVDGKWEEAATLPLRVGSKISPAVPLEGRGTSPGSAVQGCNSNLDRSEAGVEPSRLGLRRKTPHDESSEESDSYQYVLIVQRSPRTLS